MIVLPKTYIDRNGKFPEHIGKPKASHSQATSYDDPEYQNDYYVQYFMGIDLGGNDFSEFGSFVGDYISSYAEGSPVIGEGLSDEDIKYIHEMVDFPENCIYEDELCIDFGDFVMEAYLDRCQYLDGKKVAILDYKTLNLDKKADYYASDKYLQTTLYCVGKEAEGYIPVNSCVHGLGRKGTTLNGEGNWRMRLSGDHKIIPTPYTKERGEKAIQWYRDVVNQISNDYKIYLRIFKS